MRGRSPPGVSATSLTHSRLFPGEAPNALYHNNKDAAFTDVTARAGVAANGPSEAKAYKTGVAVGDYDNDGYLDLYVTAFGPNILFHNNGDGTFTDVTAKAGVAGAPNEWSTSTGFSTTIATVVSICMW
jgi:hypothetical protein